MILVHSLYDVQLRGMQQEEGCPRMVRHALPQVEVDEEPLVSATR
jgi:hypothetical protein